MCWNSNLSVQRKKCQKNLLNNCFFVFLDFDKKILWFCRKVFGRVVDNTFNVSTGTLTEQFFRMEVLETRGFSKNFWSFRDNGGKVFQTWQNSNRCPREQFMKNFFQKRKIRSFFRFCAIVYFQRNFLPELRNPQSMYPWEFSRKTIFEIYIYIIFHTFFGLWSKKRLVGKKIFFPGMSQLQSARPETFSEKKIFSKKSFVCSSVLEFEQFFLYTDKKQSGCQRNNLLIQKTVGGKNLWKKCFFKSFSDFQQKSLNN